jgi:DTW domain-containing protein YfiP
MQYPLPVVESRAVLLSKQVFRQRQWSGAAGGDLVEGYGPDRQMPLLLQLLENVRESLQRSSLRSDEKDLREVNLEEYKRKRTLEKAQRDEDDNQKRELCLRCMRPQKVCLCRNIDPISTYLEFRLLMHPKEYKRRGIGTGRLTDLALEKCKIIVGEEFDNNKEVQRTIDSEEYSAMMLYPGKDSVNLSQSSLPEFMTPMAGTPLVFILDGTWPCAKSMVRRSKSLQELPRISFDSSHTSEFTIKHQPAKYCLSTIESVHQLLQVLEAKGLESLGKDKNILLRILQDLVEFQKSCALDSSLSHYRGRSKGYKDPSSRKRSKKWKNRYVCFEDSEYK